MKTVTLVDDEAAALDVMVRAARSWRYDCQAATTAEEAVKLLEADLTPVVVTDVRMPGRGGVWLVREIQKRWPEVSIIVVTTYHEMDILTECLDAGAHHYFLKPIKLDEFHRALEATLRTYQLRCERELYRRRLERTVARQTRRLRRTFLSAIDSLVRTLEARDPYTSGHSLRVRAHTLRLARAVGLDSRICRKLSLAAKLHDIGKVGLPEGILNKCGLLTPQEFDLVRQHPEVGERILSPIIRDRDILAGIRNHHERYDGGGYPDGLPGECIPLFARFIAVADAFDALTTSRAYREALPPDQALEVLRAEAGAQFDPALIPRFVAVIEHQTLATS